MEEGWGILVLVCVGVQVGSKYRTILAIKSVILKSVCFVNYILWARCLQNLYPKCFFQVLYLK